MENWIWRVSDSMKKLDDCKNRMKNASIPTCIRSAEDAIAAHSEIQVSDTVERASMNNYLLTETNIECAYRRSRSNISRGEYIPYNNI